MFGLTGVSGVLIYYFFIIRTFMWASIFIISGSKIIEEG